MYLNHTLFDKRGKEKLLKMPVNALQVIKDRSVNNVSTLQKIQS